MRLRALFTESHDDWLAVALFRALILVMGLAIGTWCGIWAGQRFWQDPLHRAIEAKALARADQEYSRSGWSACESQLEGPLW